MRFKYLDAKKEVEEFFGQPFDGMFKGETENEIKRKVFKDADSINKSELFKAYGDSQYLATILYHIKDDWFNGLDKVDVKEHMSWSLCVDKYPDSVRQFRIEGTNSEKEVVLVSDPVNSPIKVLDYGCGAGFMGIRLALLGYDVTLMDIPHKAFQFLKYLVNKFEVENVSFKDLTEDERDIKGIYDYVICSEMLEHVKEPEEVLKHLVDHMPIGGWMYLSTFFDDMRGHDPSHLASNTKRYNDSKIWLRQVDKMGLALKERDGNGVEKGFQRVR